MLDLARRALRYELGMYLSLARWVARRPSHGEPGDRPVGYAQAVTPVLSLWIFGSAVEVPVAHVLVPWESARGVLLLLGIWGLAWMLGLLASLRVYPHLDGPHALRVRQGPRIDVRVPWDAVAQARLDRRDHPSAVRALHPSEQRLDVAVSGETNVTLQLAQPTLLRTPKGEVEVTEVGLLVDDPRAFVTSVRARLAARAGRPA